VNVSLEFLLPAGLLVGSPGVHSYFDELSDIF
jgi:hypothetical protein